MQLVVGFDFARDVGIAVTRSAGVTCVAIPAPRLIPGTRIVLADPRDSAALVIATVLPSERSQCPSEDVALGDSLQSVAVSSGVQPALGSFWFALRIPTEALVVVDDVISGDLDHDGIPESLRVCTSMEGLHFTIWSGEPLTGRRRWTEYVPLYYDVEPSCDERDFAEPPSVRLRTLE